MSHLVGTVASELHRFWARRLHRGLLIAIVVLGVAIVVSNTARGEEVRFPETLEGTFLGLALLFVILGVSIGASFFAAEWNTGSIGTLVVFDPSRPRVLVAKAIAAAIGVAVMLAVVFTVMAGALAVAASVSGTFERNTTHELFSGENRDDPAIHYEDNGDGTWTEVREPVDDTPVVAAATRYTLRAMAGVALAAVFGVAIGALIRRTAAVVGGFLLLALIGEVAIAAFLRVDVFWGPARSLITVTAGSYEWPVPQEVTGPAWLYAGLWVAAALAGALVWFSRTEVATGPR